MNSCILMAEIVQAPELRYTSDNQTPITELWVEFPGQRPEDPPHKLKVVGWGNLAQEIQENFRQGDRVIIEGRLGMNTIDRPEGFKEKRAELTVQRIHPLGAGTALNASSFGQTNPSAAPAPRPEAPTPTKTPVASTPRSSVPKSAPPTPPIAEPDFDDIPF